MKRVIWKYTLPNIGVNTIQVEPGAQVLTAQMQNDHLVVWMLRDPDTQPTRLRRFYVGLTGREWEVDVVGHGVYVNTAQADNDTIVYHVFDQGEV